MKEYKRAERVGDLILREISTIIISEIKDPRVSMVTITDVKASDDLRHANVFFSVIGDEKRWKEASAGLKSSKGFIKRELGKRLDIRYIPELKFIEDRTMERGDRIDRVLADIKDDWDEEDNQ